MTVELPPAKMDGAALTSWAPVDLGPVFAGEQAEAAPSMLARTDGRCLIYPGRLHAIQGEPESLKGWLAVEACAELIAVGETALYIDFEDTAASIVGRLQVLGISEDAIRAGLLYIRPDEPLADAAIQDLEQALARRPMLAIIDGQTEAYSRQGLNPLDNSDVAAWLAMLPRRLIGVGAAVLLIDHVVKDREQRGRYAIGAQHKLAGVDVAYSLRVIEPFAPGHDGLAAVKVEKDRPGRVREFSPDGQVALLRAASLLDGGVEIMLEPPDARAATFRPTVLMQRVSEAVEADAGMPKRAIRETVRGKAGTTDLALELLVAEGYIEARQEGRAHRHYSLRSFREADHSADRDPVSQPCPDRVPATVDSDRVPVSHPLRGDTVTAHNNGHAPTAGACPDEDAT